MAQSVMYPPQSNSPGTELALEITSTSTTITVIDGTALPAAPNTVTLGTDDTAETIVYGSKDGNTLSDIVRGFDSTVAKGWSVGTKIARYLNAQDISALQHNINDLNDQLSDISPTSIGAETPEGAQDKANNAKTAAMEYTDEKVGVKSTGASNLLPNSTGLLGLEYWTGVTSGVVAAEIYKDERPAIFKFTNTTVAAGMANFVSVAPGGQYTVSADFYTLGQTGTLGLLVYAGTDTSNLLGSFIADVNSDWHRKSKTYTIPAGVDTITIRLTSGVGTGSGRLVSRIMCNVGAVESAWNDISSFRHAQLKVSSAEVYGLRVLTDKLQFQKSDNTWVDVGGGGGGGKVPTTASRMYYVSPTGNDANDGLSEATPWKTIARATEFFESLIINHPTSLAIKAGTYNEGVLLRNISGSSSITITGRFSSDIANPKIINIIQSYSTCRIAFSNLDLTTASTAIQIYGGFTTDLNGVVCTTASSSYGLLAFYGAHVTMTGCTISNKQQALSAQQLSQIFSNGNTGTGNAIGLQSATGSTISKNGTQPTGTTAEIQTSGGIIR
ncbi:hypothetical protein [Paenibacillus segetis]|uniref:Uncharacterized protein n=1 Tax=Paenibacillus segetis TaxID=1325360 RepID=A0ABQ1YAB2_9BACL|nr:hypothetical protein [Paenibacillus segetis]GGH17372.1 hypothetical protein GCM10008013_12650 [Paenibacillus segetis]